MRRVTLRSLWAHKRRLLATVLTIVLGVSFMASTFIMSTTLDRAYDDLFGEAVENVDALVQGEVIFEDVLAGDVRANIPDAVTAAVLDIDGVAAAEGRVSTSGSLSFNRVLRPDGEPIGGAQGNTILESWIEDESLSPYNLQDGEAPAADDEVALNLRAMEEAELSVGDTVSVVSGLGPKTYTVVGAFSFGAAKSAGGAVTVAFTLAEAQRLTQLDGLVQNVYVAAEDGVSQEELAAQIAPELDTGVEVVTGAEAIEQLSSDTQTGSGFGFLSTALTIFGAIALLVGIFVISNTFSILVAQRTRELALLRALGASRAQVLGSVLLEASVVGVVAAVLGLGVGMLLSRGVTAALDASGAGLPSADLVVEPDTILLSLAVGATVTLLAALVPAIRATRVPPLAALRDVAVDRSNLSRVRIAAGALALVVGAFNLSSAWRSDGHTDSLPVVGIGAGLVVVGFLVVGPVLAGRSVRTIGLPLPRLLGVRGRLATENAARSPKRTSATASAVVIGVALVVFITVFAASATKSVSTEVNRGFAADLVVSTRSTDGLSFAGGMPLSVAETVRGIPGVDVVSPLGFGSVELQYPDDELASHFATTVEPESVAEVFTPRMNEGEVADLTDDGIILDQRLVDEHSIELGDIITITAPGGKTVALELQGISEDFNLLGYLTVTRDALAPIYPGLVDTQVALTIDPDRDLAEMMKVVEDAVSDVPNLEILDREGFIGSIVDQITSYITLVYGLLLLSIVTALLGIANTLSLSITERIRELGLLRAVGMDRATVRSTVRWEAALIASLGACVGLAMGVLLSYSLMKALSGLGLASVAFPVGWMVVIFVATALLGTLASVRPARRAASLSILDAIATE